MNFENGMNFDDFLHKFQWAFQTNIILTGRPERNLIIQKNEIIDLKINLNTTNDVNDFIALI